jgi:WD40 repeat protein
VNRSQSALLAGPQLELDDYPVDCAWSKDGRTLFAAGGEGRLLRIDAATGAATPFGSHDPGILGVAWPGSRELPLVTAGQDGALRLWDTATPDSSRVVHRGTAWPTGLAWSPRARRFAAGIGRSVCVFAADGASVATLGPHEVQLTQAAWRGEDELVACGNGALYVDRLDGAVVERFELDGGPMTLALSPDGRVAANGMQDGTVYFRYLASRKKSKMSGYDGKVDQTAWSANSRYLATAASAASTIVVWDFGGKGPEGSTPLELPVHAERIEALAWQPSGPHLASGGRDWRLALWRPNPAAARQDPASQLQDVQLLDGPVCLLRWSGDGRRLAVGQAGGRLRLYSLNAG